MRRLGVAAAACVLLGPVALCAQTADPSATPPPISSAPVAKAGTYAVSAGNVIAAPGLLVPNGNLPWALDTAADGTAALVPVHHTAITESSAAGTQAPAVHALEGPHARTVLRSVSPVFFVHTSDRTENTGDAGRGNPTGWVLVPATLESSRRTVPHVQYAQIAQGTSCSAPLVCLKAETLPDGWARLAPVAPLVPGEYVLMPVQRQPKAGVLVVYDFNLNPNAALARDAVLPGVGSSASRKRK